MSATGADDPTGLPSRLSPAGGAGFLFLALFLNSLLALLGSLLWGFIPYWPAFLIGNLAALYFGRWGIALAVLSPVATSILFHDSPLGAYLPADLAQVLLFLLAFKLLKIDRALTTMEDKVKLVLVASAGPSLVGGALAWLLVRVTQGHNAEPFLRSTLLWTAENTLPVVVPGIWLFQVLGEMYRPFAWEMGKRKPVSWMRRSAEYSAPWMMTLAILAVILVTVALQAKPGQAGLETIPDFWEDFMRQAEKAPMLRVTAMALSVVILYSLGSAVKHAKQSWILVEAVRRHLPDKRISELVTSGLAAPVEEHEVTVMLTHIRGFAEVSTEFAPGDLVAWLNGYFTRMCRVCERYGGSVDKFIGDGMMVVFGKNAPEKDAVQAIRCAIAMFEELEPHNASAEAEGFPPIDIGIGIHTGVVVAGEIGSPERLQYTVVGSTVLVATRFEELAERALPEGALPVVFSVDTARKAGLLIHPERDEVVTAQKHDEDRRVGMPQTTYAVLKDGAARLEQILAQATLRRERAAMRGRS